MEKVLDLKMPGVQVLGKEELREVDGGFPWIDVAKGILIGLGVVVSAEIIGDWDDFKDGFASAFN